MSTLNESESSYTNPPLSTTLPLYATLLVLWPTYPTLCLMNELGCGDGCGYYWGIPIFLLPHKERPRKRSWPGLQLSPILGGS